MTRACPDCPATRAKLLEGLVERPSGCAFRCLSVAARDVLPARWGEEYAIALVRRGIVVRQRVDASGRATAIDIAGPGSAIPLGDASTAYAVEDAMLCLCPAEIVDAGVEGGSFVARDVVRAQSAMLARVERLAEARGRPSMTSRVAALLLTLSDVLSSWRRLDTIPASIQQRDLAALLALRHESVCRAMTSLVRAGAIARTPGGMFIASRGALEAL